MSRVTVMLLAVLGCAAAAWGQEWQAARLWVVGSEKSIWLVGASRGESGAFPTVQMWCAGAKDPTGSPKQSRFLPAVSGSIRDLTADAQALHVLFSDLTTREYFEDRESAAGMRWRDQSDEPPLAWGGDSLEAVFWALVETETLKASATQPTTEDDRASIDEMKSDRVPRFTLLQMRNDEWQRLPAPIAADQGGRFWVAGRQGRPWLFWSVQSRGVLAATLAEDQASSQPVPEAVGDWTRPEVVLSDSDLQCGWAGASKYGPIFVAGRGQSSDRVRLYLYMREGGEWTNKDAARDGTEFLEVDPEVCGVGIGRDRLSVARPTGKGAVEFGTGEIGLSPSIRFTTLSLQGQAVEETPPGQGLVTLALMLALLTLVMWSRREQIARPIVLPPGLIFAPVWRRLMATLLDAVPAMLLTMPLFFVFLPAEATTMDPAAMQDMLNDPAMRSKFAPLWYAFVLLYSLWCLIWELAIASTPGKLLFGCRVMGTTMARPLPRQIIWRNALRVIEVGLREPGWIVTLMMMVLVTRNRQRVGDILGGTIVVMPGTAEQQERVDGDGEP
ncbi:MAG TPA: RDD family protein [Phycisphaerae bacterium]|nr:RDD family protein [Phycisphaerae bacterium]